ncbi:LysR family transcriptional regulator [Phaeovulum sp. W22_SRMD_FR3]|uniref:LysR family transcriptional regulator n=1 Tax=Phaeovulum sp. W22_SRMD_FR3 TaxID=3240274 RepID=UPI003F9E6DF1
MTDLNLLRVLVTIYETGGVGRAAERLNLSQPTVSHSLGRLRDVLGDPLFRRTAQGMVPTETCHRIISEVRPSVLAIENALSALHEFDPLTSRRTFRIAVSDLGEMSYLHRIVPLAQKEAPHVTIEAVELDVAQIEEWLSIGRIDLAIGNRSTSVETIEAETLFKEYYVALVSRDHPRIRGRMTDAGYFRESHVCVAETSGHWQGPEVSALSGARRQVALRLQHFFGLREIVGHSALVAIVPSRIGQDFARFANVDTLELPFTSPQFSVQMLWQKAAGDRAEQRWFRDLTQRALRSFV